MNPIIYIPSDGTRLNPLRTADPIAAQPVPPEVNPSPNQATAWIKYHEDIAASRRDLYAALVSRQSSRVVE